MRWTRLRWVLFWSFWTSFGLMVAASWALPRGAEGSLGWPEALRIALLDMYSWGFVAIGAIALARRVPLSAEAARDPRSRCSWRSGS
jgi:hypothetical protein